MLYYSNVPLAKADICPNYKDHNRLVNQVNRRLTQAGPDTLWRIIYYADGIFLGMRNTATPQRPLGMNPPEDEWWKIHAYIEYPTASTGAGNWPQTTAGSPEGANVMNPLNAYMFGRVTSENKQYNMEVQGPWAEGNLFDDGMVVPSGGVLTNKAYFDSPFRQRGAIKTNKSYDSLRNTTYRRQFSKYLPNPYSPVFLSNGLFAAGRQGDKYWNEYASNTVYMRYPPAVYSGGYRRSPYASMSYPSGGVLKRKNAAKDLLNFGLWCFAFYFRGSEAQRSLFCEKKSWSVPIVDFEAEDSYLGESTFGARKVQTQGPLTICDVGFDFFQYYTRQNILAPALGTERYGGSVRRRGWSASGAKWLTPATDGTGNPKVRQYRPHFTLSVMNYHTTSKLSPRLGSFNPNPVPTPSKKAEQTRTVSSNRQVQGGSAGIENSDDLGSIAKGNSAFIYGKGIRVNADKLGSKNADGSSPLFLKCSHDNFRRNHNKKELKYKDVQGPKRGLTFVLAGYYLETNPIENRHMQFKFRIWAGSKIVHETLINSRYSYAVNRAAEKAGSGKRAYVFNKLHYFKKGINSNDIKFEIVPTMPDTLTEEYKKRYVAGLKNVNQKEKYDKVISFGNPWSGVVEKGSTPSSNFYAPPAADLKNLKYEGGNNEKEQFESFLYVPSSVITELDLKTGDAIKLKHIDKDEVTYAGDEVLAGKTPPLTKGFIYFVGVIGGEVDVDEYIPFLGGGDRSGVPALWSVTQTYEKVKKVYLHRRRDRRLGTTSGSELAYDFFADIFHEGQDVFIEAAGGRLIKRPMNISKIWGKFVVEKMELSDYLFKVDVKPVILLKQRPTFHDAYALLRVATAKNSRSNLGSAMLFGDQAGVDTVGHHFNDSNKIFRNYIKYGSAESVFGGSAVPALRQYVSANPIYESVRKFVSSYLRLADRKQLIGYTVENGRGCLYFRRFAYGMSLKHKATVLRNMEPSIDPVGYFNDLKNNEKGHAKYNPIQKGEWYKVILQGHDDTLTIKTVNSLTLTINNCLLTSGEPSVVHDGSNEILVGAGVFGTGVPDGTVVSSVTNSTSFVMSKAATRGDDKANITVGGKEYVIPNGFVFKAPDSAHVSSTVEKPHMFGVFEWNGITEVKSPSDGSGKVSNEWVMFLTSATYNVGYISIFKPSVYNDIMAFLNNRCHFRSLEYERSHGVKFDMIRTELLRMSSRDAFFPGPWLMTYLSKSSSNLTYVFNTNEPILGNLDTDYYGSGPTTYVSAYRTSCPAVTKKPYKVRSTIIVNSRYQDFGVDGNLNPSAYLDRRRNRGSAKYIRVELDRPLDGTGRLGVGASGWEAISREKLRSEPYRTDENTIVEYLLHAGSLKSPHWTRVLGSIFVFAGGVPGMGLFGFSAKGGIGNLIPGPVGAGVGEGLDQAGGAGIHDYGAGYNCKKGMIGDSGARSAIAVDTLNLTPFSSVGGNMQQFGEGNVGYKSFGACYPRFYFLKLIPRVSEGSLLDVEPYAQMEFYFRAMHGAFVNPYAKHIPNQVSMSNWKFSEIASRSSEEDSASYQYVDPRDISIG